MNIMDGMDAARFKSANPNALSRTGQIKEEDSNMPLVLRDLNNKSNVDLASPQEANAAMAQQPPRNRKKTEKNGVDNLFKVVLDIG